MNINKTLQEIVEQEIALKQYDKFIKYEHKQINKNNIGIGIVALLIFSLIFFASSFNITLMFSSLLEIFLCVLNFKHMFDIRKIKKLKEEPTKRIEELNDILDKENSYPKTRIIRLLAPYHSFKADIIDGKVIIKQQQGKKMVVTGEKTIEEALNDFKELSLPFEIIRAQICERTDYEGKDNFKWREISNLLCKEDLEDTKRYIIDPIPEPGFPIGYEK